MTCTFLNCMEGAIPFKYLGIPVGAGSRRMSTWGPLLENLRKRLNSWGNKCISLGGRLILLNPVLNYIPIFFMSFLKLPIQAMKKMIRIQWEFLWSGVNAEKKLCWLKWNVVCQEKIKDDLGVRDV
ncbi:ribonuclease H [Trifolium pratense]|uniref:Ribonuclease H n=1 Tax=Trifolium pratense TaxID=57577 RepID=A0A2K3MAQ1_TRIPR|nr:ribonuclease H [Trifolium pratense]